MMWHRNIAPLLLAVLGFAVFAGIVSLRAQQPGAMKPEAGMGRVVVSAPILTALYGGDRFLAANIEAMRLAATGSDNGLSDTNYLIRAQLVAAELNPCHEDNYYLANGLLTWGGAADEGNEILRRAMDCRFWDGVPAFFFGANSAFFEHDIGEATRAFELAAQRWPENASSFRRMAIMLQAESFDDAKLALSYLRQQRDNTRDTRLRGMLELRVQRLQGLIALRVAQQRYEQRHGQLVELQQLVTSDVLAELPEDPLELGYEMRNGSIELKKMQLVGVGE
jgi:hypothetical protein